MKKLFTILGFICTSFSFGQKNNCDSIAWSRDRKLNWSDFKASPDTATTNIAQSSIRLYKKWQVKGDSVIIIVSSYLRPCFSWSTSKASDTLLQHEQGHFDISEYYRRLSIKRFSEQNFTRKNVKREIENINADIDAQQKQFVELYEQKTDFSRNYEMQMEWTHKILALVNSLQEFDIPKITKRLVE